MPSAVTRATSSGVLALAIAVVAAASGGTPARAAGCLVPAGDVTSDGATSVSDVQCTVVVALWSLGGMASPPPSCAHPLAAADLDCNASFSVVDVTLTIALALALPWPSSMDGDGDGCHDTCESAPNLPPLAPPVSRSVHWTTGANVWIDVANAAIDPEGQPVELVGVTSPTVGTATADLAAGGAWYAAPLGWVGIDSFEYLVRDSASSPVVAGPVTVEIRNQKPIGLDDFLSLHWRVALLGVELFPLANDVELDPEDVLAIVGAEEPPGMQAFAVTPGAISITPEPKIVGLVEIPYTLTDGWELAGAVYVLELTNQEPSPTADAFTIPAGVRAELDVLANDSDPDPLDISHLRVTAAYAPAPLEAEPSSDGKRLVVAVGSEAAGEVQVVYIVGDGLLSAPGTTSLTIAGEPDALAVRDDAIALGQEVISIAVLANDRVPKGFAAEVAIVSPPSSGTVTTEKDGTITYTSATGASGSDDFTYALRWQPQDGVTLSVEAVVHVEVVQHAPWAGDDFALAALSGSAWLDVLANDIDADGDPLAIVALGTPTCGAVALEGGGVQFWSPAFGKWSVCTATYTISDGHQAVQGALELRLFAEPLALAPDHVGVPSGTDAVAAVLANDGPKSLQLELVGVAPDDGTATVLPGGKALLCAGAGGKGGGALDEKTHVYQATDGALTAWAPLVVQRLDWSPVAAGDTFAGVPPGEHSLDVLTNDRPVDGDALWLLGVQAKPPLAASIAPDGEHVLVVVPPAVSVAPLSLTYTVSDGAHTATAVVSVTPEPK